MADGHSPRAVPVSARCVRSFEEIKRDALIAYVDGASSADWAAASYDSRPTDGLPTIARLLVVRSAWLNTISQFFAPIDDPLILSQAVHMRASPCHKAEQCAQRVRIWQRALLCRSGHIPPYPRPAHFYIGQLPRRCRCCRNRMTGRLGIG